MELLKENRKILKKFKRMSLAKFWKNTYTGKHPIPYRGLLLWKMPCDFFIYPDLVYNYKPDTIIEIGTGSGGSAVWFSDLLYENNGKVITIDIVNNIDEKAIRFFIEKDITFIHGDATTQKVYEQVLKHVFGKVIVIDDGSHKTQDVYISFKLFNRLIEPGGFYSIEDGFPALFFKDRPLTLPNNAINFILDRYADFKLYTRYDEFVLGTMFRGMLKKDENNR